MIPTRSFMLAVCGVLGVTLGFAGCSTTPNRVGTAAEPQSVRQVAWKAIDEGAPVIDVRTEAEFRDGHLEGAVNIPYDQITSRLSELPADRRQTIVLYCRSGRRSGIAKQDLERAGYANVINAGGYEDMMRARP